jgi:hypothetical protein
MEFRPGKVAHDNTNLAPLWNHYCKSIISVFSRNAERLSMDGQRLFESF